MKFLIDNQLPHALADFLSERGVECQHVRALALEGASDRAIWDWAADQGYAVVSKDEDFLQLATQSPVTVLFVWVRLGNCRTPVLLDAFEQLWPRIEERFRAGDSVIEIL